MTLEYQLTLADIKAAFKLHRRRRFFRRFGVFLWPLFSVICLSIALTSNSQSNLFSDMFAIGLGSLWISIFLPVVRFYQVRKCYKQLFPKARTNPRTTTEITDEFVLCTIPGVGETKYFWNAMVDFAQNENATLFYVRKNAFMFVPTAILSPAQRVELDGLVASQIGKK